MFIKVDSALASPYLQVQSRAVILIELTYWPIVCFHNCQVGFGTQCNQLLHGYIEYTKYREPLSNYLLHTSVPNLRSIQSRLDKYAISAYWLPIDFCQLPNCTGATDASAIPRANGWLHCFWLYSRHTTRAWWHPFQRRPAHSKKEEKNQFNSISCPGAVT